MSQIDGSEWKRMTLFRDYLRSHPEGARQYGMMKRELARTFAGDREGYVNGKSDFILAALEHTKQS
jgi:GrpB-like predicted nucleotidyltransferase (UPF0157 family)